MAATNDNNNNHTTVKCLFNATSRTIRNINYTSLQTNTDTDIRTKWALFSGMRSRSSIAHFLGLTLFSFKYCSSFYLRMVRTYSHSSIAHLERFVRDGEFLWTVNSRGHFLMVITNFANAGGAGGKPPLGSANTVQCQVRGCRGKAAFRISKHCSVSGLG